MSVMVQQAGSSEWSTGKPDKLIGNRPTPASKKVETSATLTEVVQKYEVEEVLFPKTMTIAPPSTHIWVRHDTVLCNCRIFTILILIGIECQG